MNTIIGDAVVNCYIAAASFLVMILLLILSERLRQRKSPSLRVYFALSLVVTGPSG